MNGGPYYYEGGVGEPTSVNSERYISTMLAEELFSPTVTSRNIAMMHEEHELEKSWHDIMNGALFGGS